MTKDDIMTLLFVFGTLIAFVCDFIIEYFLIAAGSFVVGYLFSYTKRKMKENDKKTV